MSKDNFADRLINQSKKERGEYFQDLHLRLKKEASKEGGRHNVRDTKEIYLGVKFQERIELKQNKDSQERW